MAFQPGKVSLTARWSFLVVIVACAALQSAAADVELAYDEAGRLIQVVAAGGAAQYQFDGGGSLAEVRRPSAGTVSIADFSPASGPASTLVTIAGVGFAATPAANVVTFNGLPSPVLEASANQLKVRAPTGVTTGRITVTVGTAVGQSATDFVVAPAAPGATPVVTTLSPMVATPGDTIAVLGSGFSSDPTDMVVRVGSRAFPVASATSNQLTFVLPRGLLADPWPVTGRLSVGGNGGVNIQSVLFITPEDTPATAYTATKLIAPNSGESTFNLAAGARVLLALEVSAEESYDLLTSVVPQAGGGTLMARFLPTETGLASGSFLLQTGSQKRALPSSAKSGLFVLEFLAQGGPVNLSAALAKAVSAGSLVANGASLTVSAGTPGQTSRLNFDATAGQSLTLGVSALGVTPPDSNVGCVAFSVLPPTPSAGVAASSILCPPSETSGTLRIGPIATTGPQVLLVSFPAQRVGTANLTLSLDILRTLPTDGTELKLDLLRQGQRARVSFAVPTTAGHSLSWRAVTLPGSTELRLTGTLQNGGALSTGATAFAGSAGVLKLESLPAGAYELEVIPAGSGTGSITMSLRKAATGQLGLGGPAVQFGLAAGQFGEFTFSGVAGQDLGLGITSSLFPAGWPGTVVVKTPSGVQFPGPFCLSQESLNSSCNLTSLPESGTYVVSVDIGSASGTVSLTLSEDLQGVLVPNGPAIRFSTTRVGQNGRYTFDGVAGRTASVLWSGATVAGASNILAVIAPDGSVVQQRGFGAGTPTGQIDLASLPSTGRYTVFVDPVGVGVGQVDVRLTGDPAPPAASQDGDVPIPLWALVLLGASLSWGQWRAARPRS